MRRFALVVAVGLAVAVPLAVTSLGAASRPGGRAKTTVKVYAEQTSNALVDVDGDRKASAGDMAVTAYNDYTRRGGRKLGIGTAVCTLVDPAAGVTSCVASDSLPGGTVMEQCTLKTSDPSIRCAIVGGTRRYRNARGEVIGQPLDPQASKLVVRFTLIGA
jgi:hypothetical protein